MYFRRLLCALSRAALRRGELPPDAAPARADWYYHGRFVRSARREELPAPAPAVPSLTQPVTPYWSQEGH